MDYAIPLDQLPPEHRLNVEALDIARQDKSLESLAGQHVVLVGGRLVDHDADRALLSSRVNQQYAGLNRFFYYVPKPGEEIRPIRLGTRSRFGATFVPSDPK